MRLRASEDGYRLDFGRGLLILGTLGVSLTLIFLALDWLRDAPKSFPEILILGVSLVAIACGAAAVRDRRTAVAGLAVGVAIASAYLAIGLASAALEAAVLSVNSRAFTLLIGSIIAFVASSTAAFLARPQRQRGSVI